MRKDDALLNAVIVVGLLLALAAMAYVAVAFWFGSTKSTVTRTLNEGSQVEAALKVYETEKGRPPPGTSKEALAALADGGYLAGVPQGWALVQGHPVMPMASFAECKAFNKAAGMDTGERVARFKGCPPCEDPQWVDYPGCDYDAPIR